MGKADLVVGIGALCRIDCQCDHENQQGVLRVGNVQYVGIGHVQQFFGKIRHLCAIGVGDGVIPFKQISLDLPAVAVL